MCLGPSAICSLLTGIYATSPIAQDLTYARMLTLISGIIQVAMFLLGLGRCLITHSYLALRVTDIKVR